MLPNMLSDVINLDAPVSISNIRYFTTIYKYLDLVWRYSLPVLVFTACRDPSESSTVSSSCYVPLACLGKLSQYVLSVHIFENTVLGIYSLLPCGLCLHICGKVSLGYQCLGYQVLCFESQGIFWISASQTLAEPMFTGSCFTVTQLGCVLGVSSSFTLLSASAEPSTIANAHSKVRSVSKKSFFWMLELINSTHNTFTQHGL